jgi:hypothetical protein
MNDQVKDVLAEVSCEIMNTKAHMAMQKGSNVLILTHTEPYYLPGGVYTSWQLEYRWLSNPDDVHSVQGNEFSHWRRKEIKDVLSGELGMFEFFQLVS